MYLKTLLSQFKRYIDCPEYNDVTGFCYYKNRLCKPDVTGNELSDLSNCYIDQKKEDEKIKNYLNNKNKEN